MKNLVLAIVFGFFLFGCTSMPKIDPQSTYNVIGATVKSPNEPVWYSVPSPYYGAYFARQYGEKNGTLVVGATAHKFEDIDSDTDFLNHIAEQRMEQGDETRFKVLRNTDELTTFKNSPCLKYQTLSEDHKNSGIDSKEFQ